jgi:glycerol-3-phosphate dehydrogenase
MTTFRLIGLDALKAIQNKLPEMKEVKSDVPVLNPVSMEWLDPVRGQLSDPVCRRLLGRYSADAVALVQAAQPGELALIPGTQVLWAELRWAARAEAIVHLDDLLLRRVRLGLLLPEGGREILPAIRKVCQAELGWNDERWESEEEYYLNLWQHSYSLPDRQLIPDWKAMLSTARNERQVIRPKRRRKTIWRTTEASALFALALAFLLAVWRKYHHRHASHVIS